jgi:hypothetical protein
VTDPDAIDRTFDWFEVNSGWAPPEVDELDEWLADGVCKAPDDCEVEPGGVCEHGLAAWDAVLVAAATRGLQSGR